MMNEKEISTPVIAVFMVGIGARDRSEVLRIDVGFHKELMELGKVGECN